MRPSYILPLAIATAGCFSPTFGDGEVECGEAGCPPGMSCGADGYCHLDPWAGDSGDELALAVGHDQGIRVYAHCQGELRPVWSNGEPRVRQIAWGDIDADGIPELAVSNLDGPVILYTRTPDGYAERWRSPSSTPSRAVALADFDGDGNDDLVVGHDAGPLNLYLASGDGDLSLSWSAGPTSSNWDLGVGDFDRDGDPDLAVGLRQAADKVYRNDAGTLTLAWTTPFSDDTESVAWGDVDGDGRLDLATGGAEAPVRVYRFDGTVFATAWESPMDRDDPTALAFGDYDADGDVDLATGNSDDPDRVYRNDAGVLSVVWSSEDGDGGGGNGRGEPQTETVSWMDVDRDGDLDLYVGRNSGEDLLLRNDDGNLNEAWRSGDELSTHAAGWLPSPTPSGSTALCNL